MRVELIKIKIDRDYSYKYKPYKECCEEFKNNPCIEFTCDDIIGGSPNSEPRFCMQDIEVDGNDFTYYDNYPINFCPHCGKPIEIEVIENIDFTKGYSSLAKELSKTKKKLYSTDSIKEFNRLKMQLEELRRKIDTVCDLGEYHEEDFKE